MNMLLKRCQRRAHLAEELVEEAWLHDHRDAMQAFIAEELLGECVELGNLLRDGWNTVLERLFNGEIEDIDGAYPVILAPIQASAE
jgi:hypothetical protein